MPLRMLMTFFIFNFIYKILQKNNYINKYGQIVNSQMPY